MDTKDLNPDDINQDTEMNPNPGEMNAGAPSCPTPQSGGFAGYNVESGSAGTGMPGSKGDLQGKMSEVASQARQKGDEMMSAAREKANSYMDDKKTQISANLVSTAEALRETSRSLEGRHQAMIARYADMAAQRIDQFSNALRTKRVDELVSNVEDMARRHPQLFIGSAIALGFIFSRFLKSSSERGRVRGGGGYYSSPGGYQAP